MKKLFYFYFMIFGMAMYGQSPCATDAVLKNLIRSYPDVQQRINDFNTTVYNRKISNNKTFVLPPQGSILIPVVFYIVHDGSAATNISDNQVQNQLTALNTKFSNTGISFCLATRAGTGTNIPTSNITSGVVQTTPGIVHINSPTLSAHTTTTTSQTALINTAHPSITGDKYLRIWVVRSIDGTTSGQQTLGYAWFPNGSSFFDGIVIRSNVCGNGSPNLLANFTEGETLVHEIGHYLGLKHTFEGGCATPYGNPLLDGDLVSDTPSVAAANYTCITGTNSCPETPAVNDLIKNYMDYGNNLCSDSFTYGQKERMIYMLDTYRSNLYSTDNLLYTGGSCGATNLVSATITPSAYIVCQNNPSVSFQALSADSYSWNFGEQSSATNTSTVQNPTHVYSSASGSPYTVSLTVSNNSTGQSTTSSVKIFVTDCNNYTLGTDSYWYLSSSNGLKFVPGATPAFDPSFPTTNGTNLTSVAQSDGSGNLLFYANRDKVYNKNSFAINPTTLSEPATTTGSSLISVPNPANSSQYYIFTNTFFYPISDTRNGFRRSLVTVTGTDATMSLATTKQPITSNNGYLTASDGAVCGGSGITVVKKCDGYWIITTLYRSGQNYLVSYSLTSSGLVWQNEYLLPPSAGVPATSNLVIKAAPNGNKIFISNYNDVVDRSFIYDFNKAVGSFSSPIEILNQYSSNGASFSPDSKLLYANTSIISNGYTKVVQYNLNSSNINNSKIIVGSAAINENIRTMQIGPDQKLYIGHYYGKELAVIHNPNNLSSSTNLNNCNFSTHGPLKSFGFDLYGGGLPNLIDAKQGTAYFNAGSPNIISDYPTTVCNTFKFFPNTCGTSFNWIFTNNTTGTSATSTAINPVYTFPATGSYTITLKDASNTVLGTIIKTIVAPTATISGSTSACTSGVTMTNNTTNLLAGETASWSVNGGSITGGSNTQSSVDVNWSSLPGTITLNVTDLNGCTATATATITANSAPSTPSITGPNLSFITSSGFSLSQNFTTNIPSGVTAIWSTPNGTINNATSNTCSVVWASLPAQLTLTFTNSSGCTSLITKTITEASTCDIMNANYFTYTQTGNTISNFEYFNSLTDITDATWCDFGDGSAPESDPISHTYTTNGSFTIDMLFYAKQCGYHYYQTVTIAQNKTAKMGNHLQKNSQPKDIVMYPNPTTSIINFDLFLNQSGTVSVYIKTIDGKTLTKDIWDMEEGKQKIEYKLPAIISQGTYLVEIITDDVKSVKKLIVE